MTHFRFFTNDDGWLVNNSLHSIQIATAFNTLVAQNSQWERRALALGFTTVITTGCKLGTNFPWNFGNTWAITFMFSRRCLLWNLSRIFFLSESANTFWKVDFLISILTLLTSPSLTGGFLSSNRVSELLRVLHKIYVIPKHFVIKLLVVTALIINCVLTCFLCVACTCLCLW